MTVKYLLGQKGSEVYSIGPNDTLIDCLNILNDKRVGALVVLDDAGALQGIISERDVLRKVHAAKGRIEDLPVRKVMTARADLITAATDDTIREVMSRMTENRIRHIPVLEGNRVIGIVSIGDVVKMLLDEVLTENRQMKDYISGQYA